MMQLTPKQLQQVEQAKAADLKRAELRFTAEQKSAWQDTVKRELAAAADNADTLHKIKAAAEQPGLLGDVRRAICLSRRPHNELAADVGVDPQLLTDFRTGDVELPLATLDRLLTALGLRLMQEIPR